MQVHFSLIVCSGARACVKKRVLAAMCTVHRMGAAWDVLRILALTWVYYHVLSAPGQAWAC